MFRSRRSLYKGSPNSSLFLSLSRSLSWSILLVLHVAFPSRFAHRIMKGIAMFEENCARNIHSMAIGSRFHDGCFNEPRNNRISKRSVSAASVLFFAATLLSGSVSEAWSHALSSLFHSRIHLLGFFFFRVTYNRVVHPRPGHPLFFTSSVCCNEQCRGLLNPGSAICCFSLSLSREREREMTVLNVIVDDYRANSPLDTRRLALLHLSNVHESPKIVFSFPFILYI